MTNSPRIGIPTSKDLASVKSTLRQKQLEWAEEERERAKGKVSWSNLRC